MLLAIIPLLLGADSITLTQAIPNPGGKARTLEEDGTFTLQNTFRGILAIATNTNTKQVSNIPAGTGKDKQGNLTWTGTLQLVAGTYDCMGQLFTTNNMNQLIVTDSNTIKGVTVN